MKLDSPSTRQRIARAQRRLETAVALAAIAWGMAAALTVTIVATIAGKTTSSPQISPSRLMVAAVAFGTVTLGVLAWRYRFVLSDNHVALWLEERIPALNYTLVTVVERRAPSAVMNRARLDSELSRFDLDTPIDRASKAVLSRAGIALLASTVLLGAIWTAPSRVGVTAQSAPAGVSRPSLTASRLTPLEARIVPPSYSHEPQRTIVDPPMIAELVGSRITLAGNGDADGIGASVTGDTSHALSGAYAVSRDGERWQVNVSMPTRPVALRLTDRSHDRLVLLVPRMDSVPRVTLMAPARDTTYTRAAGRIVLAAHAHDDIRLQYGYFELLVTSGADETFKTRVMMERRTLFGDVRDGALAAIIALDTMRLDPGSFLHVRAVAVDGNTVSGAGRGVSETRTIRVARADEYDSVAVTPAAPLPIDTSLISQRMLIMRTEALVARQSTFATAQFEYRSTQYSQVQEDIRKRVESVIHNIETDEAGGRFITPVSTLLRGASAEMWDARGELGIAKPREALPAMRRALRLLQKAREANRLYLRGLQRQDVVNIERVRLKGTDSGNASPRQPRKEVIEVRRLLGRRVVVVTHIATTSIPAALDSLLLIQLDALEHVPEMAPMVGQAIGALRNRESAKSALARLHRVLAPPVIVRTSLTDWDGAVAERRTP